MKNNEGQQNSKTKKVLGAVLFVCFVATLVFVLHPDLRESLRRHWMRDSRVVLSTVSGDLLYNGNPVKVIKVKTNEGLFLEFYAAGEGNVRPLLDRVRLPDRRDGFIHLRGQATNLALDDIDGDRKLEVLAPTFDEDLVAHLNVYRYNSESGNFEPVAP